MNPIPIGILVFFIGAVCLFIGFILGAGLTVIGLNAEKFRCHKGMWQMLEDGKKMIQEYFNCPTLQHKFKGLDKISPKWYEIRITEIDPTKKGLQRYIRSTATKTDVEMRWYE